MKQFAFLQWYYNISITKKIYFAVGAMALLIVIELFTLWFSITTLSSVRAYVGGEGLWSKAQKDAIYNLQKYAQSGKEEDYQKYLHFLEVPLGDRIARIEMAKENPNYEIMRKGFLQGGNHPDDFTGMIKLFRRFHNISYIHKAIIAWAKADSLMAEFQKVADDLHSGIMASGLSYERLEQNFRVIDEFNIKFTTLEDTFSAALGEGSRWLENLILKILLSIALTVELTGIILGISVSLTITKGIKEVIRVAKKISKGDFNERATVYSKDEIGILSNSFNKMIDNLEESNERFFKIFDGNPVAMILSEIKSNKIIYANNFFLVTFGYTKEEVIGHSSQELNMLSPEEGARLLPLILDYLKEDIKGRSMAELQTMSDEEKERLLVKLQHKDTMKNFEVQYTKKNGEIFYALVNFALIEIGNKKYILSSYHDITERKKFVDMILGQNKQVKTPYSNIDEQKKIEEELQKSLKEISDYKYALDESAIVAITDQRGIINYVNDNFCKISQYEREELIGQNHRIINSGYHPKEFFRNLWTTIANGKTWRGEVKNKAKDGTFYWVDTTIIPFLNEQGKPYQYLAIRIDITEGKKMEEELILANQIAEHSLMKGNKAMNELKKTKEELEASNHLKDAFLANMSHEIRTPMNAIIGFSDILSKRNLGEQEREYVGTIKSAGENLLTIINDILDISKIEAGMMTFEEHTFSVKEIFKSLHVMLMGKAKEKNLELIFICDKDVPDSLLGDSARLTQIIINLVGNAIKFTNKGSVQMNAKVLKNENSTTLLEISVSDTGIGIPQDQLPHIFERFRQANSHTARKYGGTGLGLSIAKQLVELQGGSLSVKSEYKVGSVFSFCIPYKKSSQVQVASETKRNKYNMEALQKLKILLVEDNPLNVKLVSSLFSENNLNLQVAENGSVCIEKLKENNDSTSLTTRFDIILMDMEMPVMNGYEATTIIRNELKNNTPIIAMTAHAMAGEREKCISFGMNDYISKPINANLLFETMYHLTLNS